MVLQDTGWATPSVATENDLDVQVPEMDGLEAARLKGGSVVCPWRIETLEASSNIGQADFKPRVTSK